MAPDVIFAANSPALAEVSKLTTTIPTVFVSVIDPVGQGFITNLAHPGGNVTGFPNFATSMIGKWLEILKELAPSIDRIGFMYQPRTASYYRLLLDAAAEVAPSLALELVPVELAIEEDIAREIAALADSKRSGLVVIPDSFTSARSQIVTAAAAEHHLPTIYGLARFMESGGLVYYGVSTDDLYRRAGGYVDQILRGISPGELPVQTAERFELAVNLKAARALGLSVPPALLIIADRLIE